jgi:uncharacterized protein
VSVFLLFLIIIFSLLMIPFGLPGLWVMIAAGVGYNALVGGDPIGWMTLAGVVTIAFISEVLDITLVGRYTRRYGGSRRGAWGAMIGGIAGAIVGVPIPILGSLVGAFLGAFLGALVAERSTGASTADSQRAATGAFFGRVVASVVKVGVGVVVGTWLVLAAWR